MDKLLVSWAANGRVGGELNGPEQSRGELGNGRPVNDLTRLTRYCTVFIRSCDPRRGGTALLSCTVERSEFGIVLTVPVLPSVDMLLRRDADSRVCGSLRCSQCPRA